MYYFNKLIYTNLGILNSNKAFPWIFWNKIWSVCSTRYHNVPLITQTLCLIWTCLHKIKKTKLSVDVFSFFFKYQNTVFIHTIVWNVRWNTIHFPRLIKYIMCMLYLLTTSCSNYVLWGIVENHHRKVLRMTVDLQLIVKTKANRRYKCSFMENFYDY